MINERFPLSGPMPGYWKFLWMFWMQPVALHVRLKLSGIEPDMYGWELIADAFRRDGGVERLFLSRLAGVLACGLASVGIAVVILRAVGVAVNFWPTIVSAVVLGLALALALSVPWGVAYGVAYGIDVAIGGGLPKGFIFSRAEVLMFLAATIVQAEVALTVAVGVTSGLSRRTVRVIAWGVGAGVAGGVGGCIQWGFFSGVLYGLVIFLLITRIPFYFIEVVAQFLLYSWQRTFSTVTLKAVPVLHHNLSYFPHPCLVRHILLTAEHDPALARRVLEACSITTGQRRVWRTAISQLQDRSLEKALGEQQFSEVSELRGTWLPGVRGADPLLLGFAEAARYLASANGASIPFHRLRKLELAAHHVAKLRNRLLAEDSPLAQSLRVGSLPILEQVMVDLQRRAEAASAHLLPNPFRAGEPLSLEEGRETFRGRRDLVRTIETLLGEPGRGASIALLGPRRCGKTSLLKMLPHLLPDAICILFDLQDNPIDSPAAFFTALERRAREQARRDRQIDLPKLPAGAPFEAGSRWLEALDEQAEPLRILLCVDEFERMEGLFPGSRRELLQVMGLLRATIQHRRRIRLLVSGAAPFDELDAMWNDHLINVREVKIGHLDEETAVGLLRKPIQDFPGKAIPKEVARAIVARTGGQPYLVQLYGSLLVTRLNEGKHLQADLADVPRVEEQALQQATYYLRNTYQEAPPAAQAALLDLAHDGTPDLDAATRRWLRRRLLLTDDGRLSIPVLGAWLRAEEAE